MRVGDDTFDRTRMVGGSRIEVSGEEAVLCLRNHWGQLGVEYT